MEQSASGGAERPLAGQEFSSYGTRRVITTFTGPLYVSLS